MRQGDIFRDILVFWADSEIQPSDLVELPDGYGKLSYGRGDYIVASASCDVDQPSYHQALLMRVVEANAENLKAAGKDLATKLEVLRRGLIPSQFLLAPCEFITPSFPLSVANHKVHALLPLPYLKKCCKGKRLRLRHPFREQFGNWIGASFSRVGPEDASLIPRKANIFPGHVIAANKDVEL